MEPKDSEGIPQMLLGKYLLTSFLASLYSYLLLAVSPRMLFEERVPILSERESVEEIGAGITEGEGPDPMLSRETTVHETTRLTRLTQLLGESSVEQVKLRQGTSHRTPL